MDTVLDTQSAMAAALAAALVHALWQCALLAAAAAIALRMLSRSSAALRHSVGMGFLLAMALWPAWSFVYAMWRPAGEASGVAQSFWMGAQFGVAPDTLTGGPGAWAPALSALWLMGVAWMLLRHAGGLWWVGALERRRFQCLPPAMLARVDALKRKMGISRDVVVRVVEDAVIPFTARLFRPVIWIPQELLSRMPRERLEALLAHELAHIHRLDWLWNGVQCFIESLLFFHPGVWWLSGRIRQEREHACDDRAVAVCADPVVFAQALADLARVRRPVSRLLLAANGGPLLERIARILPGAPAPAQPFMPVALACALAAGIVYATQISPAASLAPPPRHAVQGTYTPQTPLQPQTGPASRINPATQTIVDLVAADPIVMRRLGTPLAVTPNVFTGKWDFLQDGEFYGDVRISFKLAGPKGKAAIRVAAVARRDDRQWRLTELEIGDVEPSS